MFCAFDSRHARGSTGVPDTATENVPNNRTSTPTPAGEGGPVDAITHPVSNGDPPATGESRNRARRARSTQPEAAQPELPVMPR
jgi:hypothetical protein